MTDGEDEVGDEEFPLPPSFDPKPLQADAYDFQKRPRRSDFLPWHRARKQYVREHQWTTSISEVMSNRDGADRIKYIGLPGTDLLDVRHILKTVCEPSGRELHFVGFDIASGSVSTAATEMNISVSELANRDFVHRAIMRPDDLRYLGLKTTAAWQAVQDLGHVDVVNMDLTVNVLGDDPASALSYQAALRELMALQLGNPNPWVLLLTTHVDRPTASPAALQPIEATLLEAVEECPELEHYFAGVADVGPNRGSLATCSDSEFRLFMLSGVMKWLRHLVTGGQIQRRVKVTSCFCYTSFSSGDMASLVIRFGPIPVALGDDVHGVDAEPVALDPCTEYLRFAERFANARDIDNLVASNAGLKHDLIEAAADLMEDARYSREDFVVWAESHAS